MPINNEYTKEQYLKALKEVERKKWENMFTHQLNAEGFYLGEDPENLLPGEYAREYKWHPTRRWKADFLIAKPERLHLDEGGLILVELHGATHARGGHTRGVGFQRDRIKYNTATAMGWEVYEFPGTMVEDGSAIKFLEEEVWKEI